MLARASVRIRQPKRWQFFQTQSRNAMQFSTHQQDHGLRHHRHHDQPRWRITCCWPKYKSDPSKSSLHDVSTLFLRHYPGSVLVVFFHSLNPWLWLSLVLSLRETSEYKKRKRHLHVYKNQKKRMLLITKDPLANTWNMRVHAKCVCRLVVRIIKQTRRAKHPIVFVFRYVLVADTQGEQEVDTIPAMWIIFSPLYLSCLSWSRGGEQQPSSCKDNSTECLVLSRPPDDDDTTHSPLTTKQQQQFGNHFLLWQLYASEEFFVSIRMIKRRVVGSARFHIIYTPHPAVFLSMKFFPSAFVHRLVSSFKQIHTHFLVFDCPNLWDGWSKRLRPAQRLVPH